MGRDGESERKGDWLGREWNPRGAFLAPLLFSDSPYFIFLEEEAKGEEEEGTLLVEEAFSYSPEEDLRACLALSPDPLPRPPRKTAAVLLPLLRSHPIFLGRHGTSLPPLYFSPRCCPSSWSPSPQPRPSQEPFVGMFTACHTHARGLLFLARSLA